LESGVLEPLRDGYAAFFSGFTNDTKELPFKVTKGAFNAGDSVPDKNVRKMKVLPGPRRSLS
jgi:hypothetical protein